MNVDGAGEYRFQNSVVIGIARSGGLACCDNNDANPSDERDQLVRSPHENGLEGWSSKHRP